jgi:NinB protein
MPQAIIRLVNPETRARAAAWCGTADDGTAVTFATPDKRTVEQNAAMWAMLTEIASQVRWHGQQLTPDDWKLLFLADMQRGARMVQALDGRGFVNLNTSSSALRRGEFAELLDAIHKFAAANGVFLSPLPKTRAARPRV